MNVGIMENIDRDVLEFYEMNYDVVETPDYKNSTRLLKPEHKKHYLGANLKHKICRFCGKGEPEVTFKKIAHVFPESIGNKSLLSYYECDQCNHLFGKGIEDAYGKYFLFYHTISGIRGKNGLPKFKSVETYLDSNGIRRPYCEISWVAPNPEKPEDVAMQIICSGSNSIQSFPKTLHVEETIQNCCPIAVYKALVKMALTVMPFTELKPFEDTIKWIRDTEHENIFEPKKLIVRYRMIPGYNVTRFPHFVLYKRKNIVFDKPYMLFNLTYGNFSMLIEVPRKNGVNYNLMSIPFPPIPFYSSFEGVWDLSEPILAAGSKHSIALNFEDKVDITETTDIKINNGKIQVKYSL